jgi:HK97 family phage major capsid protein
MKLTELIEKRKNAQNRMQALAELVAKEDRKLSDSESTEYSNCEDTVLSTTEHIDRLKDVEKLNRSHGEDEAFFNAPQGPAYVSVPHDHKQDQASGQEAKDLSRYSFRRAFLASQHQQPLEGVEKEMHQEGQQELQRAGIQAGNGVHIPYAVLQSGKYRNDMTSGSGQGDDLIATEKRAPIDVLYDALVLRGLGARVFTGLQGNIDFPVMGAASEQTEKAENAAADEVQGTTTNATMTPNRLPVVSEISTQLLRQSSIDVERWLREHLMRNMATRIERMAVNGSGSSNQPTGILNEGSLTLEALGTNGASPTRTTLVRIKGEVSVANAAIGRLGWLTNAKVETTLRETATDSGSGLFVWPDSGESLLGYPAAVSNIVPSNLTKGSASTCSAIIFGNFDDLYIGQWGGITLLSDPYTKFDTGLVRIGAETFYDVLVSRVASFAATKDALTTV